MKRVALLLSILSLAAASAQAQWSTDALSTPRAFTGATTVGNYALFACGGIKRIQPAGLATGGMAQASVDLPSAGITLPGVRNFQCWFRDVPAGSAGFNTSDAITIAFLP